VKGLAPALADLVNREYYLLDWALLSGWWMRIFDTSLTDLNQFENVVASNFFDTSPTDLNQFDDVVGVNCPYVHIGKLVPWCDDTSALVS